METGSLGIFLDNASLGYGILQNKAVASFVSYPPDIKHQEDALGSQRKNPPIGGFFLVLGEKCSICFVVRDF
jgi:hypothetical protein